MEAVLVHSCEGAQYGSPQAHQACVAQPSTNPNPDCVAQNGMCRSQVSARMGPRERGMRLPLPRLGRWSGAAP